MIAGTAQRNLEAGRAILGTARSSRSGAASRFRGAWCCVPAACRVSQLLVGVCGLDNPRFFPW